MPVYHIVRKDDPRFAVRTVRNERSAKFLLMHLGDDHKIVSDLCTDIKLSDKPNAFEAHGENISKQLRRTHASSIG